MIITRLEQQKRNRNRFNIWTEEGFVTAVSSDMVLKYSLKQDMEISSELMNRIKEEDDLKYAKERAMEYVAYQPRSRTEVVRKLKQKGLSPKSIDEAVETLERYHYLDDAEYVREFTRSYAKRYGKRVIEQKLLQKGISREVIGENMNIDDEREEQTALDIARKALRRSSEEDGFKIRQKLFRTLVSKGFSYDLSRSVTDRVMEEIEDED